MNKVDRKLIENWKKLGLLKKNEYSSNKAKKIIAEVIRCFVSINRKINNKINYGRF